MTLNISKEQMELMSKIITTWEEVQRLYPYVEGLLKKITDYESAIRVCRESIHKKSIEIKEHEDNLLKMNRTLNSILTNIYQQPSLPITQPNQTTDLELVDYQTRDI